MLDYGTTTKCVAILNAALFSISFIGKYLIVTAMVFKFHAILIRADISLINL